MVFSVNTTSVEYENVEYGKYINTEHASYWVVLVTWKTDI